MVRFWRMGVLLRLPLDWAVHNGWTRLENSGGVCLGGSEGFAYGMAWLGGIWYLRNENTTQKRRLNTKRPTLKLQCQWHSEYAW